MMVTFPELYVLNRAIDGMDIFSLPTFDQLDATPELIKKAKASLKQKGILATEESFTKKGAILTRRLQLFKEAAWYINYQSLWVAVFSEKSGICITPDTSGNITIDCVDLSHLSKEIAGQYTFAAEDILEETLVESDARGVFQMYQQARQGFLLGIVPRKGKGEMCLFFDLEGQAYRYDQLQKALYKSSAQLVEGKIQQMMECVKHGHKA